MTTFRSERRLLSPSEIVTGGKSELHRARCRVTPGRGDSKESATESKPPRTRPFAASQTSRMCCDEQRGTLGSRQGRTGVVRAHRHFWQQRWPGKPHLEQGQIGSRLRAARSMSPGWLLESIGNGGPR